MPYAWFDNNGIIEQAGNLYNKIQNIEDEGLPAKLMYNEDFETLMDETLSATGMQKAKRYPWS
jgi:hypothetical protein